MILPKTIRVGSVRYRIEQNLDAVREGRPTSWVGRFQILAQSTDATFSILQLAEQIFSLSIPLSGRFAPLFKRTALFFALGWQAMLFPYVYRTLFAAKEGLSEITQKPLSGNPEYDTDQIRGRIARAISKVSDFGATCSYAAALIVRYRASSNSWDLWGDFLSFIGNTTEAFMAAENFTRARSAVFQLRNENDKVNYFIHTQQSALLGLIKSVLSAVAGLFILGSNIFRAAVISSYALVVLNFLAGGVSFGKMIYDQSLTHRPIDMYEPVC